MDLEVDMAIILMHDWFYPNLNPHSVSKYLNFYHFFFAILIIFDENECNVSIFSVLNIKSASKQYWKYINFRILVSVSNYT